MTKGDIYVVESAYEAEVRRRDEFGWLDGHGPGNGCYEPRTRTLRILAPSQKWAELYAKNWFEGDGIRNHEITSVERFSLDAVVDITPL